MCVLVVRRNHPSIIAFAALTLLTASCQNLVTPPDTTPLPYDPYVPSVQLVVERAVDINVAGDGSPAGRWFSLRSTAITVRSCGATTAPPPPG